MPQAYSVGVYQQFVAIVKPENRCDQLFLNVQKTADRL